MNTNLETIEAFHSLNEFARFKQWIDEQLSRGVTIEISVQDYYAGINFKERWFRFKSIDQIWRLVYPDGSFKGYWGQVISVVS